MFTRYIISALLSLPFVFLSPIPIFILLIFSPASNSGYTIADTLIFTAFIYSFIVGIAITMNAVISVLGKNSYPNYFDFNILIGSLITLVPITGILGFFLLLISL